MNAIGLPELLPLAPPTGLQSVDSLEILLRARAHGQ